MVLADQVDLQECRQEGELAQDRVTAVVQVERLTGKAEQGASEEVRAVQVAGLALVLLEAAAVLATWGPQVVEVELWVSLAWRTSVQRG